SSNTSGAIVSVRPEKINLSLYPPEVEVNCFEGRLKTVMYLGTHVQYVVELLSGDEMAVLQPNTGTSLPDPETPIYTYWLPTDCIALAAA
ncbi:MAG TPA: TOBE domain-containing protein, partial [Vampirovibrionales bacterium]